MGLHNAMQNQLDLLPAAPVIGLMGEFSRGKSALLNALMGQPLMPVHALPTTAVPTRLIYHEAPIARLIYAVREQVTTPENARHIVARRTDLTDGLREIVIGVPHPLLASGIVLLDTPGIGGLDPRHHTMAMAAAAELSVLLFVFATDPPLSAEECDFLREVLPTVPCIMLVQTKSDLLNGIEYDATLAYNRAVLNTEFPTLRNTPIYSVSALNGDGIAVLYTAIAALEVGKLYQKRCAHTLQRQLATLADRAARLSAAQQRDQATRRAKQDRAQTFRAELTRLQVELYADDAAWRTALLDIIDHLPDYVLGNLSAAIYKADLRELSGAGGTLLALNELRRVRDQLADEVERIQRGSRLRMVEALRALSINSVMDSTIATLPTVHPLALPDPKPQTVTVKVATCVGFVKRLDADQTMRTYRTAVARMADQYAGQLKPLLIARLAHYLEAAAESLAALQRDAERYV